MSIDIRYRIYKACEDGDVQVIHATLVRALHSGQVTEVQSVVSAANCGATPLLIACKNGHLQVVQYLLEKCEVDVEQVGSLYVDQDQFHGVSPLWSAAASGQFEIVKLLILNNANVNSMTQSQSTPLRAACFDGHMQIVRFLVDHGADLEIANDHGHTCLMIACFKGHINVVSYLLERGASVNRKSLKGNTALHDAAASNNVEIVKILLAHGAILDKDSNGMTPMLSAAVEAHRDVAEFLLNSGLCPLQERIDALELLGATCLDKHEDMTAALHYWKLAFNFRYGSSEATFPKSIRNSFLNNHLKAIEASSLAELEEMAVRPDAVKLHSLLLRERILGPAHPDTVYYIRLRGALYADMGDADRCLKLWLYAIDIQQNVYEPCNLVTLSIFTLFLDLYNIKLTENQLNSIKPRPIFEFELWMNVLCRAMKEVKGGMDQTDPDDKQKVNLLHRTLLMTLNVVAQICGDLCYYSEDQVNEFKSMVRELIKMDPRGLKGKTALHIVCRKRYGDVLQPVSLFPNKHVVDLLLEAGASPTAIDADFNTPLHEVAKGLPETEGPLFKSLLESGAHFDVRNKYGKTALEISVFSEQIEINPLRYTSLQCRCAQVISKSQMKYHGVLPKILSDFVDLH